jgi:hypothetical protein
MCNKHTRFNYQPRQAKRALPIYLLVIGALYALAIAYAIHLIWS